MKLIECVPNVSEGREPQIIEDIASAVRNSQNVKLLDADAGSATNRTVYTFAGEPEAVLEAAYQLCKKTYQLVDMRKHSGEHARQGAVDVCPFIPISGVSMQECVELAKKLSKRLAEDFHLPIYLYAEAAQKPERRALPDIRAGEYEALAEKLKKPEWKPDFGASEFNAQLGATVVGARKFLVAYNLNLNSKNVKIAKAIAEEIRESGKIKRDAAGNILRDAEGKALREPGLFKHLQATGWLIEEYQRAQITVNILDIEATPLHLVFEKCCELASSLGARITGSEIVGLVPKQVLLQAGKYFAQKQNAFMGLPEAEFINIAIHTLGLRDVSAFDPQHKIIEAHFMNETPLANMSLTQFSHELASESPAPGGGSVAALCGGLSASLSTMVAGLTFGKKGYESASEKMNTLAQKAQQLQQQLLVAVDGDTTAFNQVAACFKMPKATEEEKTKRAQALQEATKVATLSPLAILTLCPELIAIAREMVLHGNQNSLSDAGVALHAAKAAAWGAYYNVLINLKSLNDENWKKPIGAEADKLVSQCEKDAMAVEQELLKRLT